VGIGAKARVARLRAASSFLGLGVSVSIVVVTANCGGGATFTSRQLIALAVQPSPANAVQGGTVTFSATGTFDQAPTTQANLTAQWISSDPNIATVDPNTGAATCVGLGGPINVTASAAGKGGMVMGSGALTCRIRPNGIGVCDVDLNTHTLTGSCRGPDPILRNHCRAALDAVNCPVGQPATSPQTSSGCLPPAVFTVDTATACSN
jgi:hypothetical protein